MDKHHIHIHTAHEEALKHQAMNSKGLAQWVAIVSALLACFAAVVSYQNASRERDIILHKNEAIIKTAQATDIWNLYQAKKVKAHLMEVAGVLTNDFKKAAYFKKEQERYTLEAKQLRAEATAFDIAAQNFDHVANQALAAPEKFTESMTMLQIAIALASIAALTAKRWLLIISLLSAVIGMGLACYGWFWMI